ncbi:MAG TPA: polyprenyl synthetase family protein [Kiritimatiellia bacterium]|nr:polyprenyl synthetase family protein [Kiritimatiellia bacterium]HRZ12502.1 polyprenyl synthetase family protein [Kiritimatiellia bacterium]HSA17740.1 polyprenyl synthetase family protein [Kiritimatiellia bacterium]
MSAEASGAGEPRIEEHLEAVRSRIMQVMTATAVGPLVAGYRRLLVQGKMLRSRLAWRVGEALQADPAMLVDAGAAIEMIHAASLLHDDVIDGGYLRRGLPAFWVEQGIPGAILLGDLMLFQALRLLSAPGQRALLGEAIRLTGEVCEAESEQELMMREVPSTWEAGVDVARRKTGALFALAAGAGAGPETPSLDALRESGFLVGTAYQLADDFLDAHGDAETAGKTLGSDAGRNKATAFRAAAEAGIDVPRYLEALLAQSVDGLARWPTVRAAWARYLETDLRPALDHNLRCQAAL